VDSETNEVYVADGEGENHRVIVFDADTGAYKRHWGAYGQQPDHAKVTKYDPSGPPPSQFSTVHCIHLSTDGLVYVCDRGHDRIQIFRKDGTFVKEAFVTTQVKEAARTGALFDLGFSPDQKFMYVADAPNSRIWILLREELRMVGSFGEAGTNPGQFVPNVHDMAVDSKGNIYTGEAANGNRVQKFVYKGDRS
jgi:DNA-binding beta-propeller fold protein YncE